MRRELEFEFQTEATSFEAATKDAYDWFFGLPHQQRATTNVIIEALTAGDRIDTSGAGDRFSSSMPGGPNIATGRFIVEVP